MPALRKKTFTDDYVIAHARVEETLPTARDLGPEMKKLEMHAAACAAAEKPRSKALGGFFWGGARHGRSPGVLEALEGFFRDWHRDPRARMSIA